jgi:hypothetical protein
MRSINRPDWLLYFFVCAFVGSGKWEVFRFNVLRYRCGSDGTDLRKTYARVGQSLSQEDLLKTWQCAWMIRVFIKNTTKPEKF